MKSDTERSPRVKRMALCAEYDEAMEHMKWLDRIPTLSFPSHWRIQITPPFSFATVRFRVMGWDTIISVYLDCYDHLGCVGEPYWEVYAEDEPERFLMDETKELIEYISQFVPEPKEKEND